MFTNAQEFLNMLPLIIIGAGILISVVLEMYYSKSEAVLPWFSIILFLSAALYSLLFADRQSVILQNMLSTGGRTNIFYFIFNIGAALVCLLSVDYTKKYGMNYGEYYILIQTSVLGMMLMAGAKDLIMIFIGL